MVGVFSVVVLLILFVLVTISALKGAEKKKESTSRSWGSLFFLDFISEMFENIDYDSDGDD